MNVGERIKRECETHNIPIKRMEEECGLSNGYLHNAIVRGTVPSGKRLQTIADYFEVTPEYLLGVTKESRSTKQIAKRINESEKLRELFEMVYDASEMELEMLLSVMKVIKKSTHE